MCKTVLVTRYLSFVSVVLFRFRQLGQLRARLGAGVPWVGNSRASFYSLHSLRLLIDRKFLMLSLCSLHSVLFAYSSNFSNLSFTTKGFFTK